MWGKFVFLVSKMSQRHKILIFNSLMESPFQCYVKNNLHIGRKTEMLWLNTD